MDIRPGQLWGHLRTDLARPETPLSRELFLVVGTFVIVGAAHLTKPGSALELLALTPAVAASVIRGAGWRLPADAYAVLVIVPVTLVVAANGHLEIVLFLPVLVTLYTAAQLGSVVRASTIATAAALSSVFVALSHPESEIAWTAWTAANAFTFALGLTLRRNREVIDELRAAREELTIQAIGEERRRMARELHDTAGHTLAAVMLHITGARHVLDRDPDEARRALDDAEEVGRHSLDQIRQVVAALRMNESGTAPALAGTAALDHLVDTYRRTGLQIETAVNGNIADMDGPVGSAIHRIVQESLTNVARHAPGNSVSVVLERGPDSTGRSEVVLTVTDVGEPPRPGPQSGAQFGLIGMQERARALGGQLTAGPHKAGWRVKATVPVRPNPGWATANPADDGPTTGTGRPS